MWPVQNSFYKAIEMYYVCLIYISPMTKLLDHRASIIYQLLFTKFIGF